MKRFLEAVCKSDIFLSFSLTLIVIKTLTESFAFDTHPANDPIYFLKYKKEKLLGKKKHVMLEYSFDSLYLRF